MSVAKKTVVKETHITPNCLEKQEHLSSKRLAQIINKEWTIDTPRPAANLIDLMNWARNEFSDAFDKKDLSPINKYIHNRIIIDGQFLHFCEENNVSVSCLYEDSIISWKTQYDYEKFFAQGVFLIKSKNVEFLQGSLFSKGSNYEDEINFFVLCSNENYEAYIQLRNQFDTWTQKRDRSNLHIRVVDGEDLPYTKDNTWEDLFLPQALKTEVRGLVENFLASQDFYLEKKIPWKRGFILYGFAGCGKSSIIRTIISEYNFKPITIAAGANDDAIREAFSYAEDQSPSLLYFEDLDSLLERGVDPSTFLNLMDGISTKNGMLVIATANEVKKLKANITQRPSRFDRKFEIPLPDHEMTQKYLKKWFDNLITPQKLNELSAKAVKAELSYAYLKEIYISSMFEALSHNRKTPTVKDIDNTFVRIIKDKNMLTNGSVISTDKYFQ